MPFLVAGTGPRSIATAVRHANGWVTFGDAFSVDAAPDEATKALRSQLALLDSTCLRQDRDPSSIRKVLLSGLTAEDPLASVDRFTDFAMTHQALGFDEIVLHWPVRDSPFERDQETFERAITEAGWLLATPEPVT
jgi:alkanesulfonate monooxygenase SsuD/methylene tetrahydromethanopterin reductase-like flavin-dependent oxidoreductase (luciferase family)